MIILISLELSTGDYRGNNLFSISTLKRLTKIGSLTWSLIDLLNKADSRKLRREECNMIWREPIELNESAILLIPPW